MSLLKKVFRKEWTSFKNRGQWKDALNCDIKNCIVNSNKYSSHQIYMFYLKYITLCTQSLNDLCKINKYRAMDLSIKTDDTIGHMIVNNWQRNYRSIYFLYIFIAYFIQRRTG